MKTLTELRTAFWEQNPQFKRRGRTSQNSYSTDIRSAFVDFVDNMHRERQISDKLAQRATL